jgi:hypothetical protein
MTGYKKKKRKEKKKKGLIWRLKEEPSGILRKTYGQWDLLKDRLQG